LRNGRCNRRTRASVRGEDGTAAPGKDDPQDSHAMFFSGGVLVQGFALPIDAAFPILSEYCQRSDKPWTERELRHKLECRSCAWP